MSAVVPEAEPRLQIKYTFGDAHHFDVELLEALCEEVAFSLANKPQDIV